MVTSKKSNQTKAPAKGKPIYIQGDLIVDTTGWVYLVGDGDNVTCIFAGEKITFVGDVYNIDELTADSNTVLYKGTIILEQK